MNLKSTELAKLIDSTCYMYIYEADTKDYYDDVHVFDGLPRLNIRGKQLEEYSFVKMNNGFFFNTLNEDTHGDQRFGEMIVINGKFEGEKFYFESALKLYSKFFDYIYSSIITPIEPKIDMNTESGMLELEQLLITSFETLGYQREDIKKLLDEKATESEIFKKFMIRTGRWEEHKEDNNVERMNYQRRFEFIHKGSEKPIHVFANADGPNSIKIAKENGAEGIGLVRIENMKGTNVDDFGELFRVAGEMPISIRLLLEDENGNKSTNFLDYKLLLDNICEAAYETSPKLTIMFPAEILSRDYIWDETIEDERKTNVPSIINDLWSYRKANYNFKIGAIIEDPSEEAYQYLYYDILDSLSFGTNDISAKVHNYERNGRERIFRQEASILSDEVANVLNTHISKPMRFCKKEYMDIKIGICGYHASIPENVSVFQKLGVDYLSCIPKQICAIKERIKENTEAIQQAKENVDMFGYRLTKTPDEIARDEKEKMLEREKIIEDKSR